MLKFVFGFAVGVVIGRPVLTALNRRVIPTAADKALGGIATAAVYIADKIDNYAGKVDSR